MRNLYNSPIPAMGSLPSLVLSDGSTFLQTGTAVVVGVVLIIALVGGLIQAYQNPNCTAVCQATATAAAITWGYIGVTYLTADNSEIIW